MGTIRRYRIQIIFIIAMAALLSLSVFSYIRINYLVRASELVNHTGVTKLQLEHFFSTIKDAESSQRGYLITKDAYYRNEFDIALAHVDSGLDKVQKLTADNRAQRKNMIRLRELVAIRISNLSRVINLGTADFNHLQKMKFRANREALREHVKRMMREEDRLLGLRSRSLTEESSLTPMFTIFLIIMSIIVLMCAYFKIISNEKLLAKSNASLREKNESLAKTNKELEAFTYISSHDLQEPLRKIQTFISRIIDKEHESLSESSRNYMKRAQESANRMQLLIRDLLAYSRLKAEVFVLEKASLNDLVEEIRNDLCEEIESKKVTIVTEPAAQVRVIVPQFRQLLTNLVSNAIKFSHASRAPVIRISKTTLKGSEVPFAEAHKNIDYNLVTITDNGIGFDPNYRERIFELFQRLHEEAQYKGTGIGLSIVKKIVENHNGFICADAIADEGASFMIYIPA